MISTEANLAEFSDPTQFKNYRNSVALDMQAITKVQKTEILKDLFDDWSNDWFDILFDNFWLDPIQIYIWSIFWLKIF